MKRRSFIKGIFGIIGSTLVPPVLANKFPIGQALKPVETLAEAEKIVKDRGIYNVQHISKRWKVSSNGDIRYVGDGQKDTVLDLHRHLQDLADRAYVGDGEVCILDENPSLRLSDNYIKLQNGFNITEDGYDHLTNGSIRQHEGGVHYTSFIDWTQWKHKT